MKAEHGVGNEIRGALRAKGVRTNEWWSAPSPFNPTAWRDDYDRYERMLLKDIASLAPSSEVMADPPGRDRYWSLTAVGDLLAATSYARVSTPEFARAFVHDDTATRRGWLDAIADGHCIDKAEAASEAAWMLEQQGQSVGRGRGSNDHWFVASRSTQQRPTLEDEAVAMLTPKQHTALLDSLRADSDWIAWSAAEVLVNVPVPSWDSTDMLATDITGWPLDRAALLNMVAIVTSGDRTSERFAEAAASEAAHHRVAAHYCLCIRGELDPDGSIDAQLRRDPDLTVRPEGGRNEEPTASYWTCNDCRQANDMQVEDCPGCEHGTRPD